MNPADRPARCLAHHRPDCLGITLIILLHLGEHQDAGIHAARFNRKTVSLFGSIAHCLLPCGDFHAAACQHVVVCADFFLYVLQFLTDGFQALFIFGNVASHFGRPAFLLGNIFLQPFGRSFAAGNIRPDDGECGFAGSRLRFLVGEAISRLFTFLVFAVHSFRKAPGRGIKRFQVCLCLFKRKGCLFIFRLNGGCPLMNPVKRCHPG